MATIPARPVTQEEYEAAVDRMRRWIPGNRTRSDTRLSQLGYLASKRSFTKTHSDTFTASRNCVVVDGQFLVSNGRVIRSRSVLRSSYSALIR
jgi:hypothetical protein